MEKKTKNKFMALVEECIANKESIPGSIYSWYIDECDGIEDMSEELNDDERGA